MVTFCYCVVNIALRQASPDWFTSYQQANKAAREFPPGFVAVGLTHDQCADIFDPDTGFDTDF